MSIPHIAVQRLHNQQLAISSLTSPGEVVTWLGAVQAQEYAGGKWALGLRLPGSAEADIEQAIADKTIIRTWAVRGTLHFVAAPDVRWLVALVAPRIIAGSARRYRELELDEDTFARANDILAKALRGGNQLTRRALMAIVEKEGISTKGQRAPYILSRASLDGLICQTIAPRNDPLYLSLDEAIPQGKSLEPDDALAELARRYFTSRGPATLQDFVWWSGLLTTQARAGLEAVKSDLAEENIGGETYWRPQSVPADNNRSPAAYLLPAYDEYLVGYKDRSASLDARYARKVFVTNGFRPTIAIDGRIVGIWKRTFKKGTVVISSELFTPLTAAEERAIAAASQRYGEFLSMAVVPQ